MFSKCKRIIVPVFAASLLSCTLVACGGESATTSVTSDSVSSDADVAVVEVVETGEEVSSGLENAVSSTSLSE